MQLCRITPLLPCAVWRAGTIRICYSCFKYSFHQQEQRFLFNKSKCFKTLWHIECKSPFRNGARSLHTSIVCRRHPIADAENIGESQRGTNFDTVGSWNNRLDLEIDYEASIREGRPIPKIPLQEAGYASLLGRRKENEDCLIVTELAEDLLMFAVFDGHRGGMASEYVSEALPKRIRSLLENSSDITADIGDILQQAFREVNNVLAQHLKSIYTVAELNSNSGTTATVCLLHSSTDLTIAHVGDSRAIMCRSKGRAVRITQDHEPDNPEEVARIESCGGRIVQDSIGRSMVNGKLAMTRSFGDIDLKSFGVTAEPDIIKIQVKHGKDAFLVLCSDGLTFVLSDQEIVDLVNTTETPFEAAGYITDHALQFGSEDNTSAIVIPFGAWGKYRTSTNKVFQGFCRTFSQPMYD